MEEKKRRFVRTELRLLASMVKTPMGDYKLLLEQQKKNLTLIDIKDISTGGLRMASKFELMKGASLELTIPKLKTLDSTVLKCEVMRVQYVEGTGEYMVGLRFIPPNTDCLKQLVADIQA